MFWHKGLMSLKMEQFSSALPSRPDVLKQTKKPRQDKFYPGLIYMLHDKDC